MSLQFPWIPLLISTGKMEAEYVGKGAGLLVAQENGGFPSIPDHIQELGRVGRVRPRGEQEGEARFCTRPTSISAGGLTHPGPCCSPDTSSVLWPSVHC